MAAEGGLERPLRDRLLNEINQIIDPCSVATALPAGLVDMGLVPALEITELDSGRAHVEVRLCVTHPFCMMPAIFMLEVERRLRAVPEVASIEVSLDEARVWTEDCMSADYRARLEAQRARKKLT